MSQNPDELPTMEEMLEKAAWMERERIVNLLMSNRFKDCSEIRVCYLPQDPSVIMLTHEQLCRFLNPIQPSSIFQGARGIRY